MQCMLPLGQMMSQLARLCLKTFKLKTYMAKDSILTLMLFPWQDRGHLLPLLPRLIWVLSLRKDDVHLEFGIPTLMVRSAIQG